MLDFIDSIGLLFTIVLLFHRFMKKINVNNDDKSN